MSAIFKFNSFPMSSPRKRGARLDVTGKTCNSLNADTVRNEQKEHSK